jgi:CheY-like chemotaxis protein
MANDRTNQGQNPGRATKVDSGEIYRLTDAGRKAAANVSSPIGRHHRRILQLIVGDTHLDVIRGWLRHYTNSQLDDWLGQLEKDGMLTMAPAGQMHDLDFTANFPALKPFQTGLTDTDVMRIDAEAIEADVALKAHGAYLAEDRLKNRPPLAKSPAEITVLIVEDDPDQAALAKQRVELAGYKARVAETHEAFVEALRAHGVPDIVLLDVELPDGDGFDILVYMRDHPRLTLLPVVMLTAKNEPEDIRKGLRLGADGYIPKPYAKTMLSDVLRQVLQHH